MFFTFRSHCPASASRPDTAVVQAVDEERGRSAAMEALWGPPGGIYGSAYVGRGLILIDASD